MNARRAVLRNLLRASGFECPDLDAMSEQQARAIEQWVVEIRITGRLSRPPAGVRQAATDRRRAAP
ncbi:MAG: hypothetical protein R3F65_23715 [bacterium]